MVVVYKNVLVRDKTTGARTIVNPYTPEEYSAKVKEASSKVPYSTNLKTGVQTAMVFNPIADRWENPPATGQPSFTKNVMYGTEIAKEPIYRQPSASALRQQTFTAQTLTPQPSTEANAFTPQPSPFAQFQSGTGTQMGFSTAFPTPTQNIPAAFLPSTSSRFGITGGVTSTPTGVFEGTGSKIQNLWRSLDTRVFGGRLPGGDTRAQFVANAGNRPGDERTITMGAMGEEIDVNKLRAAGVNPLEVGGVRDVSFTLNREGVWVDSSGRAAPDWVMKKYGSLNAYWDPGVAAQEEKILSRQARSITGDVTMQPPKKSAFEQIRSFFVPKVTGPPPTMSITGAGIETFTQQTQLPTSQTGMSIAPSVVFGGQDKLGTFGTTKVNEAQVRTDIDNQIEQVSAQQQEYYQNLVNSGKMSYEDATKNLQNSVNAYAKDLYRKGGYEITEGKYEPSTMTYTDPLGEKFSYAQGLAPTDEFAIYKPTQTKVMTESILPDAFKEPTKYSAVMGLPRDVVEDIIKKGEEKQIGQIVSGEYKPSPFLRKVAYAAEPLIWGGEAYTKPFTPEFQQITPPLPGGKGMWGGYTLQQVSEGFPEVYGIAGEKIGGFLGKTSDIIVGSAQQVSTAEREIKGTERGKMIGTEFGKGLAFVTPKSYFGIGAMALGGEYWGKLPTVLQVGGGSLITYSGVKGALSKDLSPGERIASGLIGIAGATGVASSTYNYFKPTKVVTYTPPKQPSSKETIGTGKYVKTYSPWERRTTYTSQFRQQYPRFSSWLLGSPSYRSSIKTYYFEPKVIKLKGGGKINVVARTTKYGKRVKITPVKTESLGKAEPGKITLKAREGLTIWEGKPGDFKYEFGKATTYNPFTSSQEAFLKARGIDVNVPYKIIGKGPVQFKIIKPITTFQKAQMRQGVFGQIQPSKPDVVITGRRYIYGEGRKLLEVSREFAWKPKQTSDLVWWKERGTSSFRRSSPEFFQQLYQNVPSVAQRTLQTPSTVQVSDTAIKLPVTQLVKTTPKTSTQLPKMVGGQGLEIVPYAGTGMYETVITDALTLKPVKENVLLPTSSLTLVKTETGTLTKLNEGLIITPKPTTITKTSSILEPKVAEDIQQKVSEVTAQKLNQELKTQLKIQPLLLYQLSLKPQIKQKQKIKIKPKLKRITIPSLGEGEKVSRLKQLKKEKPRPSSVDVFTRIAGKEVLLAPSVTERAALDIGTSQTLFGIGKATALSASIILKPSKAPARKVTTKGEYGKYKDIFRLGKVPGKGAYLTLVQKERGRLRTQEERIAIIQSRKGGEIKLL